MSSKQILRILALTTVVAAWGFLSCQASAQNTVNAASCSQTDVQAALNKASTGDTVVIPAGTCGWTTQISWTAPANVVLKGAGSQSTLGGGDATVIIDNYASGSALLSVATNPSGTFRLTGLTFQGGSTGTGNDKFDGMVEIKGSSQNIRVDHIHMVSTTYSPATAGALLEFQVCTYGVVDHSLFDNSAGTVNNSIRAKNAGFCNSDALGLGDQSWAAPTGLGSANFLFVEDNVFNNGASNDCHNGGRFVWRHNTLNMTNPAPAVQTHPTAGSRVRGCRAWEIYSNTFNAASGNAINAAFFVSSGTGVMWGNTIPSSLAGGGSGFANLITGHVMRYDNSTYLESVLPTGWGYCGTHQTGTASPWDQNTDSTGYACIDQIGRGQGDLLVGDFPNVINNSTNSVSWPHQALEPIYEWLDAYSPVPNSISHIWSEYDPPAQQDRDYYLGTADSGSQISFNGTSGVGSGLLSGRPATCTRYVAYWATDTNTLYQCTATNAWTAYYTPYTYPHPMAVPDTTPPTAPTNLAATAVSTGQINLSWTASTDDVGVASYNIFRNGTLVGASATTSYQDAGLSPSTTYSYTVSAVDFAGNNSAQSSSASATTLSAVTVAVPAIAYVQGNYTAPQSPQTTVNVTFLAAQSAGDLNVVVVGWNDSTATVTAVTDSRGNTYKLAVGPTILAGVASQSIYYASNIAASAAGANVVTVQFASPAQYPDIRILEYQGADLSNPVDVTAASSGNSSLSNSGSATTTNATDLIFGANLVRASTTGPGIGFTSRLLTSPDGDIAEDQMVNAMGSYSVTAPLTLSSGQQWVMQMVAFRAAAESDDTGNVVLALNSVNYNSAPTPSFVGTFTINVSIRNFGPSLGNPIFFKVVQLDKLAPDLSPAQPDKLLTADNGPGLAGAVQSFPFTPFASGASANVTFTIGLGSRQQFTFIADLYGLLGGSPVTADEAIIKTDVISPIGSRLLKRFAFQVPESVTPFISGESAPDAIPPASNISVITEPGSRSRSAVAVDPILPRRMAVAANDTGGNVVVSTTEDGGSTWRPTTISRSLGDLNFFNAQDPSLAFDSLGRLSVVYVLSNMNDAANATVITESTDGVNFNPPFAISLHNAEENVIDSRPAIAIGSGGRYVAWENFGSRINVVRSEPGGIFGPPVTVVSDAQVSSPAIAIGRSAVYIGWDEWGFNSRPPYNTGGRLMMASSPHGAQLTFSDPMEIATTDIGFSSPRIPMLPAPLGVSTNLNLAVDPSREDLLYSAFVDNQDGLGIRFARSSDDGRTWTVMTLKNCAGGGDRFSPAMNLDSGGNVYISFYDTLTKGAATAQVFLARSSKVHSFALQEASDGCVGKSVPAEIVSDSVSPNANWLETSTTSAFTYQQITTMPIDESRKNLGSQIVTNLGDRTSLAVSSENILIAWTDTREGKEDISVSILPAFQGARAKPPDY
jgi:hypothetical protein